MAMATNLLFCFFIRFLKQLPKFLLNFPLLKYVKSQINYVFLITKELIFGSQILDLKDHFSASLNLKCTQTVFFDHKHKLSVNSSVCLQEFKQCLSGQLQRKIAMANVSL